MSERATPEKAERMAYAGEYMVPTEVARRLERERDEARAVAAELASVASYCLGWHDHESTDTAIKIAAALKRWKKSK